MTITKFAFPDSYLDAGHGHMLKQHTINLIHYAMPPDLRFDFDFGTDLDWVSFRGHVLDAKAGIAGLAVHGPGGG